MKSRWVIHDGRRIFIADFSNFGPDAAGVRTESEYIKAELAKEPPHSVLSITNAEGTFANEDVLQALVSLVPVTNKYVKRRGLVGVSGFRRHFLYAFAKVVGDLSFSVFDTMDEALSWIVK